ncbi:hypothetical protein IJ21_00480 [Paenibacillus sp. 32O-W]|jgi:hypothetical protein|nr:hypothetical protein IJ21_00480 [Paenibacillus sp. 32O-W]
MTERGDGTDGRIVIEIKKTPYQVSFSVNSANHRARAKNMMLPPVIRMNRTISPKKAGKI